MRSLLGYINKGPLQAITVTAVFAILSLMLPVLIYVSGAVVGLVSLRLGLRQGAVVITGSMALAGVFSLVLLGNALPVLMFALLTWVPVSLLAALLRRVADQGLMLGVAFVFAVVAVTLVHLLVGVPTEWWSALLDGMLRGAIAEGGLELDAEQAKSVAHFVATIAPLMTGLVVATLLLSMVLSVYLARWWHSLIDNPGGFAREFRELSLGPRVAYAVTGISLAAFIPWPEVRALATDVLWSAVVIYMLQGLALAHWAAEKRNISRAWTVCFYIVISVFPQVILMLALAGFSETWLKLRQRVA